MGRTPSFTKDEVAAMMAHLQADGIQPSIVALQARLGGSMSTISKYRKQILAEEAAKAASLETDHPSEKLQALVQEVAGNLVQRLWLVCQEETAAEIAQVKGAAVAEIDAALEKAEEAMQTRAFLTKELEGCRQQVSGLIGEGERLKAERDLVQETLEQRIAEGEKLQQQIADLKQQERQSFEREVQGREQQEQALARIQTLDAEQAKAKQRSVQLEEKLRESQGLAATVEALQSQLTVERERSDRLERESRELAVKLGMAQTQSQPLQK